MQCLRVMLIFILPVISFHLSCVDSFLYGMDKAFHFGVGFGVEGCYMVLSVFRMFGFANLPRNVSILCRAYSF